MCIQQHRNSLLNRLRLTAPIVEIQPTINTMKVIGVVHKTKAEAETAMMADKSCVAL